MAEEQQEEWQEWGGSSGQWAGSDRLVEPESMSAIDQALQLESVAPQWRPPADGSGLPQKLTPLDEDELRELANVAEQPTAPLSDLENELLTQSLESLDYLGDWADPRSAKDSVVLCCVSPKVIESESGPEFTCPYDAFTVERQKLHQQIVDRMLTSARTTGRSLKKGGATPASAMPIAPTFTPLGADMHSHARAAAEAAVSAEAVAAAAAAISEGGPPALGQLEPSRQHVFFVVGVPGSGKDTVLKRYLRSLGLPLLDASADLVKEYLAAWGQDDLSQAVRANNAAHGPGKHLLHAQYLHRESILICDAVVETALEGGKSLLLEKTLFNLEPVLACTPRRAASRKASRKAARQTRPHEAPPPPPPPP